MEWMPWSPASRRRGPGQKMDHGEFLVLYGIPLALAPDMALGQNLVALANIKIAGKWVFTPLTFIIIGFDTHTHPYGTTNGGFHGTIMEKNVICSSNV